jgi:hypothetical protein
MKFKASLKKAKGLIKVFHPEVIAFADLAASMILT